MPRGRPLAGLKLEQKGPAFGTFFYWLQQCITLAYVYFNLINEPFIILPSC